MNADIHQQVIDSIREVGKFQLTHFRKVSSDAVDMKAAKETVSFVDVESEKLLKSALKKILPEAGFLGEELGSEGDQNFLWIVDPIDGTTNYLNGLDHFSISVALVKEGIPIYGVVYQPYTDEYLSATKGQGAMRNGEPISLSNLELTSQHALFCTGFPYRSEDLNDAFFEAANQVLRLGRGMRRTGSAALDLAYLGMGWYGGFWESDLQPYDVAAAMVMMNEAGLSITNHLGEPYNMFEHRMMVAGPPLVHRDLLEIISKCYKQVVS
ncbi:inositol monophosphatase [Akkermansiaceae bacterium]|nr:inositol monophosphatase [Akkermansiaceae bacterium]